MQSLWAGAAVDLEAIVQCFSHQESKCQCCARRLWETPCVPWHLLEPSVKCPCRCCGWTARAQLLQPGGRCTRSPQRSGDAGPRRTWSAPGRCSRWLTRQLAPLRTCAGTLTWCAPPSSPGPGAAGAAPDRTGGATADAHVPGPRSDHASSQGRHIRG